MIRSRRSLRIRFDPEIDREMLATERIHLAHQLLDPFVAEARHELQRSEDALLRQAARVERIGEPALVALSLAALVLMHALGLLCQLVDRGPYLVRRAFDLHDERGIQRGDGFLQSAELARC